MHRTNRSLLVGTGWALLLAATPAQAGLADALFGKSATAAGSHPASPHQRLWTFHDFTRIEIVPREASAVANDEPLRLQADALSQQLAQIQFKGRGGPEPLFSADELAELTPALTQALAIAGPAEDVLLLSASRRDEGILGSPTAVTVRLFLQGGNLNLIAHDARFEFYDAYRGTHAAPRFEFGSRAHAGTVTLQSTAAANRRADWLALPLQMAAVAATPPAAPLRPAAAAPPAAPLVAVPAARPEPAPGSAAATAAADSDSTASRPAAPAPRPPLDAAGANDIERRLETLKRLRDKSLITEDEYQQKRKEILRLL